jgi:uncharacterized protein (TIGR00297 family)
MTMNHRGPALSTQPAPRQPKPWQSRLVLWVVLLCVAASLLLPWLGLGRFTPALLRDWITGAAIAVVFGLLVWLLRAGTSGAALTGSLFTIALYLASPGWRTLLWPLLALFLLTFAATRFGRTRKDEVQVSEAKHGRSASQVAANLGAAALASVTLRMDPSLLHAAILGRPMLTALVAALAEATADTLSSELGEVLGGEPRLLTTLRRVPAGTDGAISVAGTLAGCAGAAVIALLAAGVLRMPATEALAAFVAGVFGLFADSLLGATLERKGWLNNDTVNFLSTCAACFVGACLAAVAR